MLQHPDAAPLFETARPLEPRVRPRQSSTNDSSETKGKEPPPRSLRAKFVWH